MPFQTILSITFLGPLLSGESITASWSGAGGTIVTADETAVPIRTTNFEVSIGTNGITQATNYYNALLADYSSNLNITGNSGTNTLYISSKNTSNPMSGFTTAKDTVVKFNYTGASPSISLSDVGEIRARSNYNLVSTGTTATTFTTSQFIIRTFEGELSGFTSQPISYSKTKDKIVPNQNNIWINLSNLVKEKLEGDIDRFKTINYTTAIDLGANESKWATVDTINSYIGTGVTTGYTGYFVVDGYIEPFEEQGLPTLQVFQNLPGILRTGGRKELERNTIDRLYFKTADLTSAKYKYSSAPSTNINISYSTGTTSNQKYIQSVMVDNSNLDAEYVTYEFSYGSGATKERVTYYFYDECKYEKFQLVFKNKYGMLEALSMNKKSSQSLTTTASDYNRSIINYEGDFDINRHTSKQYNVTGSEQWILNTDWLGEYMNAQMKEAMLTEELWLIDANGLITPVVKVDSEIAFKTHLNDKLVQYTIKVKLSHQTIKNIV